MTWRINYKFRVGYDLENKLQARSLMSQFTVICMQEKMSGRERKKLSPRVFEIYFLCSLLLLEHARGGDSSVVRVPDS